MRPPVIISSHAGRIGATVIAVICLCLLVWDASRIGLASGLTHLPTIGLFLWMVWLFWGLAAVRIDDDGVHVINQFRIWDVSWAALTSVSPHWGLTLTADPAEGRTRTVRAWAAPAKGSHGRLTGQDGGPAHTHTEIIDGAQRPVRLSLDAADTAHLIEMEQVERHPDGPAHPATVAMRPNWVTIGITAALVVLSILM